MKRERRISIEFERREVTMTVRRSAGTAVAGKDHEDAPGSEPARCVICGCDQLLTFADSVAQYSGSQADLSHALTTGKIHFSAVGNELRLCERSLKELRETTK